jgi:hypothetical protein
MKVYLAGPITGIEDYNRSVFEMYAKQLRSVGHVVFDPTQITDPNNTYRDFMRIDLDWICRHAEAIAMLPRWEESKGAQAEWALAKALGLYFMYLEG